MSEFNLDWKKVFKEILGSPSDIGSTVTEENKDLNLNACCATASPNLNLKPPNNSSKKMPLATKDINPPELSFAVKEISPPKMPSAIKDIEPLKMPPPDFNCSGKVPEWNKVFKEILGNKSNTNTQEKKDIKHSFEEDIASSQKSCTSLKQKEQVKNAYYPKKNFKPWKSREEREVEELLARSRLFVIERYKLNDFDGAGVDCFKDGKSCLTPISRESYPKEIQELLVYEEDDIRYWNSKRSLSRKEPTRNRKPREPKKAIANDSFVPFDEEPWDVEPTAEDISKAPQVPMDEKPWDDDFLF